MYPHHWFDLKFPHSFSLVVEEETPSAAWRCRWKNFLFQTSTTSTLLLLSLSYGPDHDRNKSLLLWIQKANKWQLNILRYLWTNQCMPVVRAFQKLIWSASSAAWYAAVTTLWPVLQILTIKSRWSTWAPRICCHIYQHSSLLLRSGHDALPTTLMNHYNLTTVWTCSNPSWTDFIL